MSIMAMTTLSTKGQVVIPKEVRDALGIRPGDEMEVAIDRDGATLRLRPREARVPVASLVGLAKQAGAMESVDTIDQAISDYIAERFP
jgi:AbrB family looped-hinge helix DNA binding protein